MCENSHLVTEAPIVLFRVTKYVNSRRKDKNKDEHVHTYKDKSGTVFTCSFNNDQAFACR